MNRLTVFFVFAFCIISTPGIHADDAHKQARLIAEKIAPQVIEWRRHIHANPELSNREYETSRFVAERLREIGVDDLKTGVAHTGVIALIKGNHPGPCVALRADMDALPVTEQTGLPFASKNPGVMHACGHDVHTSVLLGAAKTLSEMRDEIYGSVKLVFQPAEEGAPAGEEGGAALMLKEGVMDNPKVSAFFALHISYGLDAGKLSYVLGGNAASADGFKIVVKGKQVHAAYPWDGIDPIVASSHIVIALQTIASRIIDTRKPVVVTVGMIHGGTRGNIIPEEVELTGTIRTHDEEVRAEAQELLKRITTQTATAHGATVDITMYPYAPVVWNDIELGKQMLPTLGKIVGEKQVTEGIAGMGAEDFSFFAKQVPSFYIRLGIRNEAIGAIHAIHTPYMIADEDSIPIGVQAMSMMAVDYLKSKKSE